MTADRLVIGAATIGGLRPRRRPVVLAPKSRRCEACLTDTEVDVCPADCPTRLSAERGRL